MFTIEEMSSSTLGVQPYLSERRVHTSVPIIDSFLEGFQSSQVAFIDSSDRFVFDLTHLLCVNALSTPGEEVVWVDGGNSINPYEVAGLCKRLHVEMEGVLDRINIARAFTAYQMATLIVDRMESEVRRSGAGTLIVSCFPSLFHDKDIWWSESFQLIRRCLLSIGEITRKHELVTVVTNYGLTNVHRKKSFANLMYRLPDRVLRIENRRRALQLSLVKEGRVILYRPVPYYQTTLDEFRGRG